MVRSRVISMIIGVIFLVFGTPAWLGAQAGCDVTVDAGADQTFCEGGQTVNLNALVTGDFLDLSWAPVSGIVNPNLAVTQATVDTTITYTITVRSRSSVDLITNGDFSQGDTGFTSDYVYGTGGSSGLLTAEGQYAIDDNAGDVHNRFAACTDHTTGNGQMMIVNASGMEDNFWCQTVTVNQGTSYDFSAWVTSVNDQNPARLQFSIGGELLGSQFNASTNLCTWDEFSAQWTAPTSSDVEICVVNVNLTPAGNDFAIDDIAFRELCETTDTITFTVLDLNTTWNNPGPLCQNDEIILLDELLSPETTPGGTWTLDGQTVASLDPSKTDAGQYTLRYSITEGSCQESDEQMVEVLDAPYAGAPGPSLRFCEGSDVVLILQDELQGEDAGGIWTETSLGGGSANSFDPNTSELRVSSLTAGNYSFNYAVGSNSACGVSENEVRVVIDPPPAVDLGDDRSFKCDETELVLGAGITPNPNYSYSWTDQSGATLGTDPQLTVNTAGTYRLVVSDNTASCQGEDEVMISDVINNTINATISALDASCFDTNDGSIIIEGTDGGTAPYLYALNDNPFSSNPQFGNLAPGNYRVTIMDAAGCNEEFDVVIDAPGQLQVMIITDDPTVNLGDSIQLEAVINNPVAEIKWTPEPNCTDCTLVTVRPTRSTTYFVEVTDVNGCKATDRLTLQVKQNIDLYVPNAFSPNEDGVNDRFFINAGEGIRIRQMQVVDRWGTVVFQKKDFSPNDPGAGWDGYYRGTRIPSSVVVYSLELELPNGEEYIQSGEIAVIY
ncbi:T9SS type B sorting domain-containing protein [Flavilitoribacter nigricans]|nr:gliding motility-associated C-terminal domain-containing protein [Flavilitoribacter nigricans]